MFAPKNEGPKELVLAHQVEAVYVLLPSEEDGAEGTKPADRPGHGDGGRLAAPGATLTRATQVEHRFLAIRPPPPLEGKVDLERGESQPLEDPSGKVVAHLKPEGNILAILPPFAGREMAFLCIATLVPRILLAMFLGVAGDPERWEYDVIAANIVSGQGPIYDREGFVYAAYAPPLWSYGLALLLLLPGDSRATIQIVQALLCLGAAVVTARIAHRISGDSRTAMLAALLVALQPSLLYYSVVKSDPLPLNVLLLSGIALAGLNLIESGDRRWAVAFGVLTGLGILSRGTPAVALIVVGIVLAVRFGSRGWSSLAIASLSCALSVSPWLARNIVVIGSPLITSTTGENFWRGNHFGASGGVVDLDGGRITLLIPSNPVLPASIRSVLATGTELERHETFMAEARRFISADPWAAAELFARKLRTFWWRIDSDPGDYPARAARGYEWIFRVELVLALLGAWITLRSARGREAGGLCLGLIVAISLLQCAFYVQGRHRFLIEPLLLAFTAIGLAQRPLRRARTA